jgi:hypothetical protein
MALNNAHQAELDRIGKMQRATEARFDELRSHLEQATKDYVKTGVAFVTKQLANDFNWIKDRRPSAYFRDVARELNRPFVHAFEKDVWCRIANTWRTDIWVEIPATERNKNLIAGFTLLTGNGAVEADHTARLWRFKLNGDAGRECFASWREQCCTNPVMRVTLKL